MKYINLTQAKKVLVDDEDFDYLNQWSWRFQKHRDGDGYAVRSENHETILMHRVITNCPERLEVDHINRDKLDNRRSNLRNCSRTINQLNRKLLKNNTTGHTNVVWNKRDKGYYVQLRIDKKVTYFGFYKDLKLAISARDEALVRQLEVAQRKGK